MRRAWLIMTSSVLLLQMTTPTQAQDNSLAHIINQRSDLSTLAAFFNESDADFQSLLDRDGAYTVFAPNNLAFVSFAQVLDMPLQDLLDKPDVVTQLLRYHLVAGTLEETDVRARSGQVLPTMLEDAFISIRLQTTEVIRMNSAVEIVETDIRASNGVLHIINDVLVNRVIENALLGEARPFVVSATATPYIRERLGTTATPTQVDAPLLSLGEVLDAADNLTIILQAFLSLETGLQDFYNTAPEITFLAPTDQAFINLFATYDLTEAQFLADERLVTEIMLYHTVREALIEVEWRDLVDESVITVLPPTQAIFVTLTQRDTLLLNNLVEFNTLDIPIQNGFVHTVDNVLLPQSVLDTLNNT